MNIPLPKEPSARKVRADAVAILALGVAASAAIITLAVMQFRTVFTPNGVVWNLPVEPQPGAAAGLLDATADAAATAPVADVTGTVTQLQVVVPNLNTVSTFCLGASIVLLALAGLVTVASVVRIAWLFQQGRFFTLSTSHALRAITWAIFAGGLAAWACWNLAANGIEGALAVQSRVSGGAEWWAWYWIVLFTACSFGLIDVALRRAIRVQHDAEGLV
ncbi:hypothetical protein ACXR2T_01995 [Leucobacter sp. HY1910]